MVRQGKGGKTREVFISQELKAHLEAFLAWKRANGEGVSEKAPVFTGRRAPLTRNGVLRVVKGLVTAVGLNPRYATHSCRHTYATHLYRACGGDLEVVQEQLGHASIKTTTIYAKVTKEDKKHAANALANACGDSQQNRETGASWRRRVPLSLQVLALPITPHSARCRQGWHEGVKHPLAWDSEEMGIPIDSCRETAPRANR